MSRSKHAIKISRPASNCSLSFWQYNGMFSTFLTLSGRTRIKTETAEYHYEYIRNGPVEDEFYNRSVLHTYKEADINLATLGVTGFRLGPDTVNNPYLGLGVWVGSTYKGQFGYRPGASTVKPGAGGTKIISNSPTECVIEYWRADGNLDSTQYFSLLSTLPVTFNGYFTITYRERRVYSDYLKRMNPSLVDTNVVRTAYEQYLRPVGDLNVSVLPPDNDILAKIEEFKLPTLKPDIVKDSFFSDVLSQYALPDVNNIENLKDLRDIKKSIPPIVKLLRRKSLKSFSELYLWYKYTYSTSKMDIMSYYKYITQWLKDSMSKNSTKHVSVTYSSIEQQENASCTQTTRYNIYTDNYNCGVLRTLGLDLSMSNTWDLIPLSFVVDWFINFGDILKTLDNREIVSELKVHSVVTSNKYITTYYPLLDIGISAPVIASYYNRGVSRELPSPMSYLTLINPVRHTTDGLALLIARK